MEINFSNIRAHGGSKDNGFEELVCQLAHLDKPEGAKTFVRKEGAGGDAGLECYWQLEDSREIGWQAKYFIGGMGSSEWGQLDKSFKTALKKHSKLSKYIVSVPIDKTDSRKKGRGGKKVVSVQDEWNKRVVSWTKLAKEYERDIEFEFWGKHELTHFLSIDNPLYSGRVLYWFNEPILGFDIFEKIVRKSQESLGDRYTPEFHVELPIAKSFDGLCSNQEWWAKLLKQKAELADQRSRFYDKFHNNDYEFFDKQKIEQLQSICLKFINLLTQSIEQKIFFDNLDDIKEHCYQIQSYQENIIDEHKEELIYEEQYKEERAIFHSFFNEFSKFSYFLESKATKAGEVRAALLHGEPGIGKSHLLCDLSLHRIENKLPTLFVLGQHYEGGDPIRTLKSVLDLSGHSNKTILGALDTSGETYRTKTLIIIDAINEGSYRDDWHNHIRAFLSEVSLYNNISVLLSCRTTYLDYMLPESINEDCLVQIQHMGFQGYEHRAAEKYMSKQGISKPSAPILAPEFTNPLFLKTCCQALKDSGLKSFPKGLHGITSIFNFYMQSTEKTISKRKKYSPNEEIIKSALIEFATKIFPDNLSGIPMTEARNFINVFDPNPNNGDSLFDELINEGVISEDISYHSKDKGSPVIRFTYERFSDHFVSKHIIAKYDKKSIKKIFLKDQPLGKIIEENGFSRFEGIFQALSILIAEKYYIELIDLLPEELATQIDNWVLSTIFSETIVLRSAESFTDRTLEILNNFKSYELNSPALDILLRLSTEPEHPWNANLLHKNLVCKSMAERDKFWSIYIALGDQVEEDGQTESIIRTLIEWACFGVIEDIEEERARLCVITLLWFLTTPNRKVRDQSTKSLVRLLSCHPKLLPELLNEFHDVNDLYLVERLYAVAYGVVCNINDRTLISKIAEEIYDLVFKNGEPIPHILLRDYARGILEYAFHLELTSDGIIPDKFRPPYKSDWPIENPSEKDIDMIEGDEFSSHIKSSLMGFPGDFGNYTMGCIHNWSPTPLSEPEPKTGYEYKKEFADEFLQGDIKDQFLERLKPAEHNMNDPKEEETIKKQFEKYTREELTELLDTLREKEQQEEEDFRNKLQATFNEEQKEHFRWLNGLSNDRPAAFSRKWAQRWVCKRAHELGWKKELFESFEQTHCSYSRGAGSRKAYMERIGKKYQWIALHELLARLSDNVHWIDRGYSDIDDKEYYGPWQMHKRDIDPTIWIRSSAGRDWFYNKEATWWQNYEFPLDGITELDDKLEFMWSEEIIPDFSKILEVSDPKKNGDWFILHGFYKQKQEEETENSLPSLDAWFRINSIVSRKSDYQKIKDAIGNNNLIDPHTVNIPSTLFQSFLGEYPWHPSCRFMNGWVETDDVFRKIIPVRYLVPISQYEWESTSVDHSLDSSLYIYMPAADLINDLQLSRSNTNFGAWLNDKSETIFLDPSVTEPGPSFALIQKNEFLNWLNKNGLELLWLIGGEKQLFDHYPSTFYGRLVYNGLFRLEDGKPSGSLWFEKQQPDS